MHAAGLNIVAIGGGTGLSTLLRGLKRYVDADGGWSVGALGAIVTVTDEGGSSGVLRKEFGMLPPGDIRNCIVALAEEEQLLSRLFSYRF
ncbi:MAG TPA: 2-phospho-L-lactate transferase CofD family protein, partial [Thermoanaerobaculia bacterium]|nr:2-phospho-L-lactate transferase CofD family protein [Thermoanaerobaculia bacterium]